MGPRGFLQNEKQVSEFLTALKGRKGIPLKFVYLEDGAKNWDAMIENRHYGLGRLENDLLRSALPRIFGVVGNRRYNIIDIGPGNGKKARTILTYVRTKTKLAYYIGLDISQEMLNMALRNLRLYRCHGVAMSSVIIDFEQGNFSQVTRKLRQENYPRNLFFLLGNTIGNPFDKDRVLTNIRESMTISDYLVIGLELADLSNTTRILQHYQQPVVISFILFCLRSVGIKPSDGKIEVRFNKLKSQIEMRFRFTRSVHLEYEGEVFKYSKGDRVLLLISYKSDRVKMEGLLERTGFRMRGFYTNPDNSYGLILCQPKRY